MNKVKPTLAFLIFDLSAVFMVSSVSGNYQVFWLLPIIGLFLTLGCIEYFNPDDSERNENIISVFVAFSVSFIVVGAVRMFLDVMPTEINGRRLSDDFKNVASAFAGLMNPRLIKYTIRVYEYVKEKIGKRSNGVEK